DRPHRLIAGKERVAVRQAIRAAENAAGAVLDAVAGGVAERRLRCLDDHLDNAAGPAAILPGATRIRAEFVRLEEQRKAHFGDFEAAEFDAARRLPLAAAGPAIAGRGRAAAGPRLKEMPDKGLAAGIAIRSGRARVLALDRDAKAAAPAGHRPVGAGRRQRLDDRFDNFLAAMIG